MHDASRIFAVQDGLATIDQLHSVGVTEAMIRARLVTGEWERIDRDVVGLAGAPHTWRRRVRAAVMTVSPVAAASHVTAARLHGFDGFDREPQIHVTVAGLGHHNVLPGHHVHRSTLLTPDDCVRIDGILVVSKPIALVQVAGSRGRDVARRALDGVLRDGASTRWIDQVARSWRRRGVKGPQLVLELVAETERRLPRSWFQRLGRRVLATTGVRLVDEHTVLDPASGRRLADLDLASVELMIGIECQSWHWHATPTRRAADALRKRRLQRLGWHIIELWWADLHRPEEVLLDVQHAISSRRG